MFLFEINMINQKLNKALFAFFIATVFAQIGFGQAGSLDTTFGGTEIVTTSFLSRSYAKAADVMKDGTTYVAESIRIPTISRDILVMRYLSNGSLDTGFGTGGFASFDLGGREQAFDVAINRLSRKITVVGYGSSQSITARYSLF
jgi:hypothetical protein